MANTLITSDMITKRAMLEFKNASVMLKATSKALETQFGDKVGDTIKIRKPIYYSSHTAEDITSNLNTTVEGSISVTLDKWRSVGLQFTQQELALDIDDFAERHIKPAMARLAQDVESSIADVYKEVWNFTGTPGTTPSTFSHINENAIVMDELGIPMEERVAFYNPKSSGSLADGLKGVFPSRIATRAIEYGGFNEYAGFMSYRSPSIKQHTNGAYTTSATPIVNGGSQNVTYLASKDGYTQSLITDGWGGSNTVLEGDTFTIAGVNSVNPMTGEDTGRLQSFVVRADNTDTGADMTILISPPMITSGANKTVTAAAADNAVITFTSGTESVAYGQNLLWHKNAISVPFATLPKPPGSVVSSMVESDGISMRYVEDYSGLTNKSVFRFDILFSVVAHNPNMICRHTD
jgi:hypothetical protein